MIKNKTIICLLMLSSTVLNAAVSADKLSKQFEINLNNNVADIRIPIKALEALNKWNKNFKVYEQSDYSNSILGLYSDKSQKTPMSYIADIDGDGEKDIVLLGEAKSQQKVVAILNKKTGYKVVEIKSWGDKTVKKTKIPNVTADKTAAQELGVPVYILEPEGDVVQKIKGKTGVQVEAFLGITEVFFVDKDKAVLIAK